MNFEKPEKSEFWKTEQKIAGDIILQMCTKKHNHMRYSSWDTKWGKLFLSFWAIFYPPPFPNIPENQNFQKMKKASGDIIILNLCNKKQNQMMYAYSYMECGRHNFLSFQAIFFSFSPLLTPKIKIYYPFTHVHQRSRSYNVWYLRYKVQRTKFFVILSHFFAHWPLLTTQKIKILKK